MSKTTIQIDREVLEKMKELKLYPRQTYNDIIIKMIEVYQNFKHQNQYDEFLHKIQQSKMQELWDNKYDEEWENA